MRSIGSGETAACRQIVDDIESVYGVCASSVEAQTFDWWLPGDYARDGVRFGGFGI